MNRFLQIYHQKKPHPGVDGEQGHVGALQEGLQGLSGNRRLSSTVPGPQGGDKEQQSSGSASARPPGPGAGALDSSALRPAAPQPPPPLMAEPLALKPLH